MEDSTQPWLSGKVRLWTFTPAPQKQARSVTHLCGMHQSRTGGWAVAIFSTISPQGSDLWAPWRNTAMTGTLGSSQRETDSLLTPFLLLCFPVWIAVALCHSQSFNVCAFPRDEQLQKSNNVLLPLLTPQCLYCLLLLLQLRCKAESYLLWLSLHRIYRKI